jgi:hypothetical protein
MNLLASNSIPSGREYLQFFPGILAVGTGRAIIHKLNSFEFETGCVTFVGRRGRHGGCWIVVSSCDFPFRSLSSRTPDERVEIGVIRALRSFDQNVNDLFNHV